MKFGEYIKKKREQRAWSQPEAAAKVGIEQSYLSKIETGKSYPSEDTFSRLVEAFEIDTSEMSTMIFPGDLDRLREIKEVRVAVLERQKSERFIVRNWLIAGLASLVLGGACFGVVLSSDGALRQHQYQYRSMGVLALDEQLTTYDVIDELVNASGNQSAGASSELTSQQQAILERIHQRDIVTTTYQGDAFVKKVLDGRRYYQLFHDAETSQGASMRWLLVPAFMFMFGSFGCFFVSFRWQ